MSKKYAVYIFLLFFIIGLFYIVNPAFSQSPTPDCYGTLKAWEADKVTPGLQQWWSEHKCYCPSAYSQPVCVKKSTTPWGAAPVTPSGNLSPSQQFAVQAFGSLMQGLFQGLFAPSNNAYQQQMIRQQEEARKKEEAMKKQALERWKSLQKEEKSKMTRQEAQKRQRGQELLAKIGRIGSDELSAEGMGSGKLEPYRWGTAKPEFKPIGTGRYDTSGLLSWQRFLCAAYFSTWALSEMKSGNPKGATFLNSQASKVIAGDMTDVECNFPALPQPPEPQKTDMKMQKMTSLFDKVQIKVKHLQEIENKLYEARKAKHDAEIKLKEAEEKISEIKNQSQNAKSPEEKSQYDDLLKQVLALRDNAKTQLDKARQSEEEYLQMKKNEINEIKKIEQTVKREFGKE
jgi:hypothetical protein